MDQFPQVYPSSIQYRPGRIQSLSPECEILLKQCWATLLKFWGYGVQLSENDIRNEAAFVVSEIVEKYGRANPNSRNIPPEKKKRPLFLRNTAPSPAKPLSSQRAKELESGAEETYVESTEGTKLTKELFFNVYRQQYANYFFSDSDSDTQSIDTFVTTETTMSMTLVDISSLKIDHAETCSVSSPTTTRGGFRSQFRQYEPLDLHASMFKVIKNELIDNFVLRYIRARKHKYDDAMAMLTKTLHWRQNEYPVEKWLQEGDAPSYVAGENAGLVKNFTVSKFFIRGHDKNKNPLFVFQSKKHFAADTLLSETERFSILIIEWCRLHLREISESVDTCSLVFDLSGFSLKNADNATVKFLNAMFESHYPESLGIVMVHNAPWIFSTIWNVIKNWLDPVVASKIHFTKGTDDLEKFIDVEHIPEYLGGADTENLDYPVPTEEHTRPIKAKDANFYRLCAARDALYVRFIDVTIRWIQSTNPAVSSMYLREKIYLSYELSHNYIALDPYLRNPGVNDRNGFLEVRN